MRFAPLFAALLLYILKAQPATSRGMVQNPDASYDSFKVWPHSLAIALEARGALQGYEPNSVMQKRKVDEVDVDCDTYDDRQSDKRDEHIDSDKRVDSDKRADIEVFRV